MRYPSRIYPLPTPECTITIVMLHSLAKASGQGSVTVDTTTRGLDGEVVLTRRGGSGKAHGQATVSCETRSAQGSSGTDQRFTFEIKPGGQQQVWQHSGDGTCTISVTVNGKGFMSVALRGY